MEFRVYIGRGSKQARHLGLGLYLLLFELATLILLLAKI
jgi:hypothetical protein